MNINTEREMLQVWLKINRTILADRTPDEVAMLARTVGFDGGVVCEVLSHFRSALQGSSFDNIAKMQSDHHAYTVELMSGKVFLDEHWRALRDKQNFDRDFEEAV